MKRNTKFIITLLYVMLTINVRSQTPNLSIRIDPDNAKGANVSDFFDKVEIIPLETTKESVFGRVYQLKVIDNRFIIGDAETDALLIFSADGKFIRKLKMQKDFSVDRENKRIVILDVDHKVSFYDLNGHFLGAKKIIGEYDKIFSFPNGGFALNSPRPLQPSKIQEIKHDVVLVDSSFKILDSIFPYDASFGIIDFNQYYDLFNDQANGISIFSLPYRYTVSEISDRGVDKTYKFIFPEKYSLPKDFDNDSLFFNKRKDFIFNPKTSQDYYSFKGLNPFYRHRNFLIFNTNQVYMTYNNDLLYDLNSNSTYSLNRFTGDSTSFYLPILHSQSQQSLQAVDGSNLYTTMPASAFLQLKNEVSSAGKSSDELFRLSEKIKATDNPIIMRSRFRQDAK